jgi:four helix bundle protein
MAIAQKECNETLYWLELLIATQYLTEQESTSIFEETTEIMKLITSIIKSTKSNGNL